ncbi:MAG: hypothetical protein HS111_12985 [Kofleriaceae bacterium]|nr:hypothetical protein [Kofleriaceae bacterium]
MNAAPDRGAAAAPIGRRASSSVPHRGATRRECAGGARVRGGVIADAAVGARLSGHPAARSSPMMAACVAPLPSPARCALDARGPAPIARSSLWPALDRRRRRANRRARRRRCAASGPLRGPRGDARATETARSPLEQRLNAANAPALEHGRRPRSRSATAVARTEPASSRARSPRRRSRARRQSDHDRSVAASHAGHAKAAPDRADAATFCGRVCVAATPRRGERIAMRGPARPSSGSDAGGEPRARARRGGGRAAATRRRWRPRDRGDRAATDGAGDSTAARTATRRQKTLAAATAARDRAVAPVASQASPRAFAPSLRRAVDAIDESRRARSPLIGAESAIARRCARPISRATRSRNHCARRARAAACDASRSTIAQARASPRLASRRSPERRMRAARRALARARVRDGRPSAAAAIVAQRRGRARGRGGTATVGAAAGAWSRGRARPAPLPRRHRGAARCMVEAGRASPRRRGRHRRHQRARARALARAPIGRIGDRERDLRGDVGDR